MIKNLLIVGTRPNYIKAFSLSNIFEKNNVNYKIVVINQHFNKNLSEIFIDDFFYKKKLIKLNFIAKSRNELAYKIYLKLSECINKHNPKNIFIFGDVDTSLHSAICAKNLKKKIIHIESGLRSFDNEMPEETNRIFIDKISDVKFYTEKSAFINLKKEKLVKNSFFVGNTMIDALKLIISKNQKKIINPFKSKDKKNIYITLHRPSNVDNKTRLIKILKFLKFLSKNYSIHFSIHPRTKLNIDKFKLNYLLKKINILKPTNYLNNINLMIFSDLIITDSGGMQEELAYLGCPFIALRKNTERPVALNNKNSFLCNKIDNTELSLKINMIISKKKQNKIKFWDGLSADRIFKILKKKINLI